MEDTKIMKIPQRDPVRDKELIAEYNLKAKDGAWKFTVSAVAYHFDMSPTRLYQVLDHYKIERRTKK